MHIIDPVNYTANQRAEFRLPSDGLFLSNLNVITTIMVVFFYVIYIFKKTYI